MVFYSVAMTRPCARASVLTCMPFSSTQSKMSCVPKVTAIRTAVCDCSGRGPCCAAARLSNSQSVQGRMEPYACAHAPENAQQNRCPNFVCECMTCTWVCSLYKESVERFVLAKSQRRRGQFYGRSLRNSSSLHRMIVLASSHANQLQA